MAHRGRVVCKVFGNLRHCSRGNFVWNCKQASCGVLAVVTRCVSMEYEMVETPKTDIISQQPKTTQVYSLLCLRLPATTRTLQIRSCFSTRHLCYLVLVVSIWVKLIFSNLSTQR